MTNYGTSMQEADLNRAWTIEPYRTQLSAAIQQQRWDYAERIRVALKRRMLELVGRQSSDKELKEIRDVLSASSECIRLYQDVELASVAAIAAHRLLTDSETAAIAAELAPLPHAVARDTMEAILQVLSQGNKQPHSTSELATLVGRRVETVSRTLTKLRAEGKVISTRRGKGYLHRLACPRKEDYKNSKSRIQENKKETDGVMTLLEKTHLYASVSKLNATAPKKKIPDPLSISITNDNSELNAMDGAAGKLLASE